MALHITDDDALLTDSPLALLVGMLLDQQVRSPWGSPSDADL